MKLRNKKTGEIVDVESLGHAKSLKEKNGYQVTLSWATEYEYISQSKDYHSLAELNEDWEDVKEPLIKDPKIRKAIRAWAEANNVTKVWHEGSSVGFCDGAVSIKFHELCWEEIPKGEYTIAELCGEEEE